MIAFLITVMVVLILYLLITAFEDKQIRKEIEEKRINSIQKRVLDSYDEIRKESDRFGNEFYTSLNNFAINMDRLCGERVKKYLKPYDVYEKALLIPNSTCHELGCIVIDKDLVPKFMLIAPSAIKEVADIELEVAHTSDSLRVLAEKCKNIKLQVDEERKRKETVSKIFKKA